MRHNSGRSRRRREGNLYLLPKNKSAWQSFAFHSTKYPNPPPINRGLCLMVTSDRENLKSRGFSKQYIYLKETGGIAISIDETDENPNEPS